MPDSIVVPTILDVKEILISNNPIILCEHVFVKYVLFFSVTEIRSVSIFSFMSVFFHSVTYK